MARMLTVMLKEQGAEVVLTRGEDYFVNLQQRPAIANQRKADAFVSIHLNSSTSPASNGTETYYYSAGSAKLASVVYNNLVNDLKLKGRGIRTASFAVINKNDMPAILTEASFISNPNEAAKLKNVNYQKVQAKAIFKGLKDFFGVHSPKPKPPAPAPPVPTVAEAPAPTQVSAIPTPVVAAPAITAPPMLTIAYQGITGTIEANKFQYNLNYVDKNIADPLVITSNVDHPAKAKIRLTDIGGEEVDVLNTEIGPKASFSFVPAEHFKGIMFGGIQIFSDNADIMLGQQ